jgi:dolichol-phosphate mannosyltransferase
VNKDIALISIVIPAYNEADGIPALYDRLSKCAATWNGEPYEFIFVDDGSSDGTLRELSRLAADDHSVKIISFSRNFGHQAAVTAGLCYSTGDITAVIDADLQDPPEELWRFFEKCREGYDVVYAIRTKRKENFIKRCCYFLYYRMLAGLSTIDIPLDAGDFCVMSRRLLNSLNSLPERNRFVRGLRSWVGFRQTGLTYERQGRFTGEPKYTLRKLINLGLDGVINFSYKPLRVFTLFGLGVSLMAFMAGLLFLFQYLSDTTILGFNPRQSRGWTSLILAILFLAGTQILGIGIIGEYLGRLFEETKSRPPYVVKDIINFAHNQHLEPGGAFLEHAARFART